MLDSTAQKDIRMHGILIHTSITLVESLASSIQSGGASNSSCSKDLQALASSSLKKGDPLQVWRLVFLVGGGDVPGLSRLRKVAN